MSRLNTFWFFAVTLRLMMLVFMYRSSGSPLIHNTTRVQNALARTRVPYVTISYAQIRANATREVSFASVATRLPTLLLSAQLTRLSTPSMYCFYRAHSDPRNSDLSPIKVLYQKQSQPRIHLGIRHSRLVFGPGITLILIHCAIRQDDRGR
jgi:hypothetical protein